LEIALVLSELATIPGARTPDLVIFFAIQKCWQRWRSLFFMVTVFVLQSFPIVFSTFEKKNTSDFRTQIRQKGPGVASDGGK